MNINFDDWEAEQMRDPEFRAAAEELEPAYQADRLRIIKDHTAHLEQKIIDVGILLEELECKLPVRCPRSVWIIVGDLRRILDAYEDVDVSAPGRVGEEFDDRGDD